MKISRVEYVSEYLILYSGSGVFNIYSDRHRFTLTENVPAPRNREREREREREKDKERELSGCM